MHTKSPHFLWFPKGLLHSMTPAWHLSEACPWCSYNKTWMRLRISQLRHQCHIIEACIDLLCTLGSGWKLFVMVLGVVQWSQRASSSLFTSSQKGRGSLIDFQQETRNKAGWSVCLGQLFSSGLFSSTAQWKAPEPKAFHTHFTPICSVINMLRLKLPAHSSYWQLL